MKSRYYLSAIASVLSILFLIVSCKDDPSSATEEPPTVPPASSMEMSFSTLESNKEMGRAKLKSAENFTRAALTALAMKGIVELNLVIPRTLLAAANNTEGELNQNEEWEWSFSKTARDTTYEVSLLASRTEQDSVNWRFYITNPNLDLDEQLFFDGTTNTEGTSGVWRYYSLQNTSSQEQVSRLDWTVNASDNIELRLEVISDRYDNQGDYIDYMYQDSLKTAVYYDRSDDQQTEIQFNVNTRAGYIIAPNYNNGEKACWDENLQNIACGEL